ncbi:hypothetical protein NKH77_44635 [Streptomyces sp. M19]
MPTALTAKTRLYRAADIPYRRRRTKLEPVMYANSAVQVKPVVRT